MASKHSNDVQRREVLKVLGAAGGLAAAAGTAAAVAGQVVQPQSSGEHPAGAGPEKLATVDQPGTPMLVPAAGPEVRALFGDLVPGAVVGRCRLVAVHAVTTGAIPVVLATESGAKFQVDVHRRELSGRTGSSGVASTQNLALYLLNDGNGSSATVEEQGLGAMALAESLLARERAGAIAPPLLTLDERTARHPRGIFKVLA